MERSLRAKLPDDPVAALAELARILAGGDAAMRAFLHSASQPHDKKRRPRHIARRMKTARRRRPRTAAARRTS
jgi:hypothetical protein